MQKIYLENIPLDAALAQFQAAVHHTLTTEEVSATMLLGRTTAAPVFACMSAPHFKASAMDGIAVIAAHTAMASEANPVILNMHESFVFVDTGDPIDEPYNSVIMVEDIHMLDTSHVEIRAAAAPWQNVRAMGEDMVAGEMILPSGRTVTPEDIGAVLAGGVTTVTVYAKPRVAIIPTGDEIVSPGEPMTHGSIIDSNSHMLHALCLQNGCETIRLAPIPDDYDMLQDAIKDAIAQCDLLLINAGSSAGSEDHTYGLISQLGTVLHHGIAIKPGKPTVLGIISGKPVIGTPGYPLAAYTVFQKLVLPMLHHLYPHAIVPQQPTLEATLTKTLVSSLKHEEYVPVNIGTVENRIVACPIQRGAGITMSLSKADGFIKIPQTTEGISAKTACTVYLKHNNVQPQSTIFSMGSHDLIMDLIGDFLSRDSSYRLVSTHVGSQGGLLALRRMECHLAPTHLLDSASGIYNIPAVHQLFPNQKMVLVHLVKRTQGLMVLPGNPHGVMHIGDIASKNLQIVNRQRGSGTRMLFDHLLNTQKIPPQQIAGYTTEVGTHMAVGAAVLSQSADVGLGSYSAAKALGLDFIPVGTEDYDLLMYASALETPSIQALLHTLSRNDLKHAIVAMGGYTTESMGEIISC